jgi:hypothetical protein
MKSLLRNHSDYFYFVLMSLLSAFGLVVFVTNIFILYKIDFSLIICLQLLNKFAVMVFMIILTGYLRSTLRILPSLFTS